MTSNEVALQRRTTHAFVVDEIHRRILHGQLAPGDRLVLDNVARELGVSATPVREALHALVMEGTVTLDPYRGFSVSELTVAEAEDLYETRAALECLAARLAVPRLTAETLAQLREALDAMGRALEANDSPAYVRWDTAFHNALYAAAGRTVLNRQLSALITSSVRYHRYQLERLGEPGGMQGSIKAHRLILEAAGRGDARLVDDLIREHLATAAARVVRSLSASQLGDARTDQ